MNKPWYWYLLALLSTRLAFGTAHAQSGPPPRPLLDSLTLALARHQYPNIHAVLISQRGQRAYTYYAPPYTADSLHDTRSAFKSVTSLLVGIALDKGYLHSVQQRVYDFFPDFPHTGPNWDARKQAMTLQDLLEMKPGFACEEFNGTQDCEDVLTTLPDWVRASLDLPMAYPPGTQWAYTSAAPIILSGVLARSTQMSVPEFAARYLFEPLGITHYRWTLDPTKQAMTAGSFYIRPADMLRIGELVANQGVWQGRRLVSAQWLRESMAPRTVIPDFSFVGSLRTPIARPQPTSYGYYWYRERIVTASSNQEVLFASGNGGQYILLVPSLHLVAVFTGGSYGSWKSKLPFEVLAKYVIPAFELPGR